MKKIVFWMVALLLVSSAAMAQGNRKGGERMDPKTMAQHMTERMVKQYSLNEDQQKQLLELNQSWVEKMSANQNGHSQNNKDAKATKGKHGKNVADMKKAREDYDAQLQKIMTKEQYDSYVKKQTQQEKGRKDGHQNKQRKQRGQSEE